MELARGEYFKWLSHDDYCDPTFVEKCLMVVQHDPNVALCYSQFVRVDEEGRRLGVKSSRVAGKAEVCERFRSLIYRRDSCEEIYGVTRTAVIKKTALLGAYSNSDDTFLAELILYGQFREVEEPLLFYRIHSNQSTNAYPTRSVRMAWFNPAARTRFTLPFLWLFAGYLSLLSRSPLTLRDKIRCYSYMSGWFWHFKYWLAEDLRVIRLSLIYESAVPWFRDHAPWSRPVWHWIKRTRNDLRRPESPAARARRLRREQEGWEPYRQ